ncbi:hypothetical protein T265_05272 [Opisthorchis viverrini]|uniref:Uncharacterized protein n=1 Tax=Opisthorchis viverrini TaxID=6198 RepID=A0A074ZK70_OPIVI|nr:hypothetical protein T265_05272 [Opisthorchis viverrini]KER27713.1 hypothetical protein T265_05272 [Opisthorchis viverrini]
MSPPRARWINGRKPVCQVPSETIVLQEKEIKHRETRFVVDGFEAGNHSRSGLLDTLNEGDVFHNLFGVLQERSDVGPIEYLEGHASNTGEDNLFGVLQERSDVGPIEYLEGHASNTGEGTAYRP